MKRLLLLFGILSCWTTAMGQGYTFTPAGASGHQGPTQSEINTAYQGTALNGAVTSVNGIQYWVVPGNGNYIIEAVGASGGGVNGGNGAAMEGVFALTGGDTLMILVGQQGVDGGDGSTTGGGGTFVILKDHTSSNVTAWGDGASPLIIAGGGGGNPGAADPASDANLTTDGNNGNGVDGSGLGGINGNGGQTSVTGGNSRGGGGGGFLTNGDNSNTCGNGLEYGLSFLNGGEGGLETSCGSNQYAGGFGGGGGSISSGWRGSGAGGGYSGGGGGQTNSNATSHRGGGGGSFNAGLNANNVIASQAGDGTVTITPLSSVPNDAGVTAVDSPTVFCAGAQDVIATIQNFGTNQITSLTVNWSVDGVAQTPFAFSGTLDTLGGNTPSFTQVNLGSYNFTTAAHQVSVWTSSPNGSPDTVNTNDTVSTVLQSSLPAPTGLSANVLSSSTANISWTPGSLSNSWLYTNVTSGTPVSGTGTATSSPNVSLSGLNAVTTYDFYVREVCPGGDTSAWAGPITYTTPCAVTPAPYLEDFETASGTTPPNCWTNEAEGGGQWEFDDETSRQPETSDGDHTLGPGNGGIMAWIDDSDDEDSTNMLSPLVDLSALSDPRMVFWFWSETEGSNPDQQFPLHIDVKDASGWTHDVAIFDVENASWERFTVDLSSFGDTVQVRFSGEDLDGSFYKDIAIDDVSFEQTPDCESITNVYFSNISSSQATLFLDDSTTSFQYEWGPCGFSQGTGTVLSDSSTALIPGLASNTCYDVYIRMDCDTAGFSAWSGPFSFTTACSSFSAPYSQNFDGTTEPEIDNCWTAINSTSSSSFVGTENLRSNSGPNSLELFNSSTTSGDVVIVSPEFSDLDSTKQIRFFVNDDDDASDLIIGTMSDRNDPTTFTPYDTITAAEMPDDTWQEFVVRFENNSGSDGYIAFRHGMGTTSDNIYIDDFEYELKPACVPPDVTSLGVANLTSSSADLFWGSGSAGVSTYIEYGTPGFTPGTFGNLGGGSVAGTVDTLSISGLAPLTAYEFYVRDSCLGTGYSPWVGPFSFSTPVLGPQGVNCTSGNSTIILTEEFDNSTVFTGDISTSSGDWNYENNSTGSGSTGPNGPFSGSHYIYFEGSGSGPAEMISPAIDLTSAVDGAELAFWLHAYGDDIDYLHVTASTSPTGPFNDTLFKLESGIQTASSDPWQQVGADLSSYLGQVVYINFTADRISCCSGDIAIDLLTVEACGNFCLPPNNLTATGVVDTAATLAWDTTSAGSYQVWFGPQGFFQGTQTVGGARSVTNTNSLLVDTLTGQTCYEYLVRGICGTDTSLWAGPFGFCTPCSPVQAPYFENFDAVSGNSATGDLGNCWTTSPDATGPYSWRTNTGSTGSGSTGPNGDATTGSGVYLYTEASSGSTGDSTFAYSPLIDISGLTTVEMRYAYHMYGGNTGSLEVEVNAGSGWVLESSLQGEQQTSSSDPWRIDTVDLSAYTGLIQVRFKGIRGTGFTSDISIDDFIIEQPVPSDLALVSADFDKNTLCLSSNDTLVYQVSNIKGSTYDLSTDPLVLHYDITGPVNSTGSAIINSGTIPAGDTGTFTVTGVDLSLAGSYSLDAWIGANNFNLSPLNDSLDDPSSIVIREVWDVQPDSIVVVNSPNDTVNMTVTSSLLGGLADTSIVTSPPLTPNNGQSGITFELEVTQPLDMIGIMNVFSTATSANLWMRVGGVQHATGQAPNITAANGWVQVVTNGVVTGANSNTPVPMDFGSTSVPLVPNTRYGFFVEGDTRYQTGTATDQTTFSDGIVTIIVDDDASYGGTAPSPTFNPRRFLGGIIYELPAGTSGFNWSLNGQLYDTLPNTFATGWTQSGVYNYVANYNSPCGVFSDTVVVVVNLPGACPTPTNLGADVITCDNVDVSWNSAADSALVWYVPTGGTPSGAGNLVIGDSTLNITGTVVNTTYDFYVANICGNDTSSLAGPFSFDTDSVGAPMASFTYNAVNFGLTLNFDASGSTGSGNTYDWDFGDGNLGTGEVLSHTYASGGSYSVTLTVTNACGVDDTTIIITDVSISDNELSRSLRMYPNPAKEKVDLSYTSDGATQVRITDMSGKTVMLVTEDPRNGDQELSLNISSLAHGVYMVEITNGDMKAVRRLIKE